MPTNIKLNTCKFRAFHWKRNEPLHNKKLIFPQRKRSYLIIQGLRLLDFNTKIPPKPAYITQKTSNKVRQVLLEIISLNQLENYSQPVKKSLSYPIFLISSLKKPINLIKYLRRLSQIGRLTSRF